LQVLKFIKEDGAGFEEEFEGLCDRPAPSSGSVEGQQLEAARAAYTAQYDLLTGFCLPSRGDAATSNSSSENASATIVRTVMAASSAQQLQDIVAASDSLQQLPSKLLAVADSLCAALPVPCCCNNPDCGNLAGPSEQQLVAGKGCVCARCKTARWGGNCCTHMQQAGA
jgi:hypothetical protein